MQRVKMAEAARSLGLHKATVTRWVQKHPALADESGQVSIDELRAHRDTVVNPRLQTRMAAVDRTEGAGPALPPKLTGPSLNDMRNRTESAKAESAELDLAERLNLTLRRDDVEAAVAAAGEVMKQTAQLLARDRAEALARIGDVRAMERALEDLMRELLSKAGQSLSLASLSTGTEHAA